jgi:hypothetical protein
VNFSGPGDLDRTVQIEKERERSPIRVLARDSPARACRWLTPATFERRRVYDEVWGVEKGSGV